MSRIILIALACTHVTGSTTEALGHQVEGRIEGFPSDPAGSLLVSGQLVTTDVATVFRLGNAQASFGDLEVGQRVHVVGEATADGVLASAIRIQNTRTDLPGRGNVLPPPPQPEADSAPVATAAFDPDAIYGWVGCEAGTCGFAFSPREDITVVGLGQWDEYLDGLDDDSTVTLWADDGTPLASVAVPAGTAAPATAQHRYMPIAPLQLVAGQTYVIGSAYPGGPAPLFDPSGVDPTLLPIEGRAIAAIDYPSVGSGLFFGGGSFQFLVVSP
jgi:hypothetical protein